MGEHNIEMRAGAWLLLAEKVRQFTCYWRTIHVMLGLQSRDHAKKRKENTSWSQATFVFFRAMPPHHLTPALVACRCRPPPPPCSSTIRRLWIFDVFGSTSQLRSIIILGNFFQKLGQCEQWQHGNDSSSLYVQPQHIKVSKYPLIWSTLMWEPSWMYV